MTRSISREVATTFRYNFVKLMDNSGYTCESLAERVEELSGDSLSASAIKKYRAGTAIPNIQTLLDLASVFDISIESFFKEDSNG